MTDREKAIVMAYTGAVMLTDDKLGLFYEYVSEKLGWSIQTIDLLAYADKIKACAKEDFIKLCSDEVESEEGKYKYAIEEEIKWLEEDISIIENQLETEQPHSKEVTLRLKKSWDNGELIRLHDWQDYYIRSLESKKEIES